MLGDNINMATKLERKTYLFQQMASRSSNDIQRISQQFDGSAFERNSEVDIKYGLFAQFMPM